MPPKTKKRPADDAFVAVNFRLSRADAAALQAEIDAIGDGRSFATHLRGIAHAHIASRVKW